MKQLNEWRYTKFQERINKMVLEVYECLRFHGEASPLCRLVRVRTYADSVVKYNDGVHDTLMTILVSK